MVAAVAAVAAALGHRSQFLSRLHALDPLLNQVYDLDTASQHAGSSGLSKRLDYWDLFM